MNNFEKVIIEEVAARGTVTFARYMDIALYHPRAGYYMREDKKIGVEGDFYTSPDVSPLFGYALAEQFAQMWLLLGRPDKWQLVEYGAGKGTLARDVLLRLKQSHSGAYAGLGYYIIEVSPGHRAVQQENARAPEGDDKIVWVNSPEEICPGEGIKGCIFSNELVDSFPVHRVRMSKGELREIYVRRDGGRLVWEEGGLSCGKLVDYLDIFSIALEEGQTVEINLEAENWIGEVSRNLAGGFLLTIDYGGKTGDIYNPFRLQGSLRCYSRHRLLESPLEFPGGCDITSHVNFSSLIKWGEEKGMNRQASQILEKPEFYFPLEEITRLCGCILVLGGDGTMLNTARIAAPSGIPLLGINLGRLGFLSELDIPDVIPGLEKLVSGHYSIEERMMLKSEVVRRGKLMETAIALNDAVITKGAFARLIRLKTDIDGEDIGTYPADGIIVASPTGSTAYSLSAGGPVVTPEMELMLITPICPHSLWARPLVISSRSRVEVKLLSDNAEVMLTMDGQHAFRLEKNDSVVITSAPHRARFVKFNNRSFFSVLHSKLNEGDLRNG